MKRLSSFLKTRNMRMLVAGIALSALMAIFALVYRHMETLEQGDVKDQLQAIANLKVESIAQWRTDRLNDARDVMEGIFFSEAIEHWLAHPEPARAAAILERLRTIQTNQQWRDVVLVDATGHVRLSIGGDTETLHDNARTTFDIALRERTPQLSRPHVGPGKLPPHIDAIAPIFAHDGHPLGAIVLQADLRTQFFPLVTTWPLHSASAENLLIMRDGDSVLFINDLRYQVESAMTVRIPLTATQVPAVMAVLGQRGLVTGLDYRNVPVLSVLSEIPGSDWFLVTKIDKEEALEEWHLLSRMLIVLLVLACGTIIGSLVWSLRSARQAAALVESEARFRRFFEKNQSVMMLIEPDSGRIVDANLSAAHFYGYPLEKLVGMPIAEINTLPPADIARERQDAFHEKRNYFNFPHRLANGEIRDVEVYSTPIITGKQPMLFSIVHDISARKRLEREIQERVAEQAAILNNSSIGIALVRDRRLVWTNHRMSEIFGYSPPEMQGRDTRMFYDSDDNFRSFGKTVYATILAGERHVSERILYGKEGQPVWVRMSGQLVDPHTPEAGSIWVFEDIAQQKENELALIKAREEADAANVAKSRFLATMSHEIRTPMNGILGMAQMLMMPDIEPALRLDYARTILNSGQILLTLLNDILDLSKVEAGKLALESMAFEPAQVLHETKALFDETAHAKGLDIDVDWHGPARQRYDADAHRLRQMLSNLVSNAIKFTTSGRVSITAEEVESDERTALLRFHVRDTGAGIPADTLPMLFRPFSQADSSITRQYGGTGLGLSIVRSLARLMGGEAGVESQVGKGSHFWFTLRVKRVEEGEDTRHPPRPAGLDTTTAKTEHLSGHILVVEDNPINRKVVAALLGKLGLTAEMAEHGQAAVDTILAGRVPDLVLMDIQMPVMDGYTATTHIREWERELGHPHLPIVALTADAFAEDRQHCLNAGMDDYIAKPVALDALRQVLERLLRPAAR
jgi:PAS domain S-box-containing protein